MDVQRQSVVINACVTILPCQHKRGDNEKTIFFFLKVENLSKREIKSVRQTDAAEM